MPERPTLGDIQAAHERFRPYIHRTPVMTSSSIDAMVGARLYFKCDNLQKVGAFKIRGASNAVLSLTANEAARGVVTHSSGNHAAALAQAAGWRGIAAYIVMPEDAPQVKKDAVRGYGGQITFCPPTVADREATAARLREKTGATFIHPYNDVRVIAGQGTAAIEFLEDTPGIEVLLVPVGGGGLLAGTLIAVKTLWPNVRVIATEPERVDDAYRSWKTGRIVGNTLTDTIADGLKTNLGELTFPIIRDLVDEVVRVPEESILPALRVIVERMKIVVEPSSAVPLAALLSGCLDLKGQTIGIHLGGGNVDLASLARQL